MIHRLFTFLIHIALVIILAGAIVTYYCGIQGELTLTVGDAAVTGFVKTSGPGSGEFPFAVALDTVWIDYYPGTATPMDFHSMLHIDGEPVTVSMNKVAQFDDWRFFQSGISPSSSRLTISHDPVGTAITYVGYGLLFIGMVGFFFQKNTAWRSLLRSGKKVFMSGILLLSAFSSSASVRELPAMQRPLAADMGKVYVYWNDRICPLQTMAKDVALKLYGSESYRGMTPEQILSGWLFYFDTWERDYSESHGPEGGDAKKRKLGDERKALIHWLGTGEAFRIYPYRTVDGHTEWLSLTGRRPSGMSLEQWKFMQSTVPGIKECLLKGRNIKADKMIGELMAGQIRFAGRDNLPSPARMQAECFYNSYASLLPPAVLAFLTGLFYLFIAVRGYRPKRAAMSGTVLAVAILWLYVFSVFVLLWWISGHVPLSNGSEIMLGMSLLGLTCSLCVPDRMLKGAFLIVAAMTLVVGFMGGRSPRIGMLMPVLSSPLLSVHVMLIMTAYVFFLIMALLAAVGIASRDVAAERSLYRTNRIILVPALFLLAAGIFVGAVWANQSWGRYWGWDPKETCALVMLLVYSVPAHWATRRLKVFRKPKVFQWYLLCAVLTVLFTYFGANYFLSGLHSYV